MLFRFAPQRLAVLLLAAASLLFAAVPTPKEHFGYTPGDDYKLAGYQEIAGYFQKLASSSERIKLVEFGKSAEGRAMYAAFISSEENLRKLDRLREVNRKLALGEASAEEAARLIAEGRTFVWIDSGLHATEVAPVQQAPHLAYKMLTDEGEEAKRIRENVILVQIPVINPDGLDLVAGWYKKNLGTPHEVSAITQLYQKYAGHDNNRDYFMLNLTETRHVSRMLFREWFPQIVYNQHQVAPFPARIFIPPYAEPLNPNIPAPVMEGINLIGTAMRERFAREDKPGVVSYLNFDAWWNGGLRSAPAFHNMHGILTETALYAYATPRDYKASDLPARFANGMPTKEPSVFYERPWLGGRWALMDAINYMLTADFAILDLAAGRREHFLRKAWEMARTNIEEGQMGKPFSYLVPVDPGLQHDPWTAVEMLKRLQGSGIEIQRASAPIAADGKTWPAGTYVLPAAQSFRGYLMDLMEPQKYPEIRTGESGPTKRPYDLAGWTLPYQMGVKVERVDAAVKIASKPVAELEPVAVSLDGKSNAAFLKVAELLESGERVRMDVKTGRFLTGLGLPAGAQAYPLSKPRVGVYQPWAPNMDAGWTEWMLDEFKVPYKNLRPEDVRALRKTNEYDVVILAQQPLNAMLHGWRLGERSGRAEETAAKNLPRPEHTGGIGVEGAMALLDFVRSGGTLIAFDSATQLPLTLFPVGVRGVLGGGESSWYCPGSVLRATVDTAHPLAAGMPTDIYVTSTGGQGFEIQLLDEFNKEEREARAVVNYAKKDLLASGWLSGERVMAGKAAMVDSRVGMGHVVLFGFRPQFRGQTFGTFKLVLNAIYRPAARPVQ